MFHRQGLARQEDFNKPRGFDVPPKFWVNFEYGIKQVFVELRFFNSCCGDVNGPPDHQELYLGFFMNSDEAQI